jgi:predicted small secreted protein
MVAWPAMRVIGWWKVPACYDLAPAKTTMAMRRNIGRLGRAGNNMPFCPFACRSLEERHMKYSLFIIAPALIAVLVSGCSTTAGVGKDLQSAGKAITETAEKEK